MYRDKLYKVEMELRDLLEEAWRDGFSKGYSEAEDVGYSKGVKDGWDSHHRSVRAQVD